MDRRDFIGWTGKAFGAMAGMRMLGQATAFAGAPADAPVFGLHPFLDAHPDAVFIRRTAVPALDDAAAKLAAGRDFAREVFVTKGGGDPIPASTRIAVKPNLTMTFGTGGGQGKGIITDRDFTEGLLGGLLATGFPAGQVHIREGNTLGDGYCYKDYAVTGYVEMAARLGVHMVDLPSGRNTYDTKSADLAEGSEVVKVDCPDGMVFRRIGYLAPCNAPGSWMLNLAKLKSHAMGMTLCCKNLQGTCVVPYVRFCHTLDDIDAYPPSVLADFNPDRRAAVEASYARHVREGYPRWDRQGKDFNGGMGMELWAQRTCDSLSVLKPGLSVIEAIYAQDGNGFTQGPGPDGLPRDYLVNMILFGKDPLRVDMVGTWLAGHEPSAFGFFHIARERGLLATTTVADIPLFQWEDSGCRQIRLSDLPRTPLATPYLRRDYGGQSEEPYHLVTDTFASTAIAPRIRAVPTLSDLGVVRAPGGHQLVLRIGCPADGHYLLEAYDLRGSRVAVVAEGWFRTGVQSVNWAPSGLRPGIYMLRLRGPGGELAARPLALGPGA